MNSKIMMKNSTSKCSKGKKTMVNPISKARMKFFHPSVQIRAIFVARLLQTLELIEQVNILNYQSNNNVLHIEKAVY